MEALLENIVDVHVHMASQKIEREANPWNPKANYFATAEEMVPYLQSKGTTKAILMSNGEASEDSFATNEICRQLACKYESILYWMCNFDPVNIETIEDRMKLYKEQGAVGVGELMINQWMDSPIISEIFRCAEKYELPVTFHMSPEPGYSYGICDYAGLPLLEKALQTYPNLKLVGHSQMFWAEISKDCPKEGNRERTGIYRGPVQAGRIEELMTKYENLYCDLSAYSGSMALMRDKEYGISFLRRFQDRLCFGTDTTNPYEEFPLLSYLCDLVEKKELEEVVFHKIVRENARKLYKI